MENRFALEGVAELVFPFGNAADPDGQAGLV